MPIIVVHISIIVLLIVVSTIPVLNRGRQLIFSQVCQPGGCFLRHEAALPTIHDFVLTNGVYVGLPSVAHN
jgi:hypothetical protein